MIEGLPFGFEITPEVVVEAARIRAAMAAVAPAFADLRLAVVDVHH